MHRYRLLAHEEPNDACRRSRSRKEPPSNRTPGPHHPPLLGHPRHHGRTPRLPNRQTRRHRHRRTHLRPRPHRPSNPRRHRPRRKPLAHHQTRNHKHKHHTTQRRPKMRQMLQTPIHPPPSHEHLARRRPTPLPATTPTHQPNPTNMTQTTKPETINTNPKGGRYPKWPNRTTATNTNANAPPGRPSSQQEQSPAPASKAAANPSNPTSPGTSATPSTQPSAEPTPQRSPNTPPATDEPAANSHTNSPAQTAPEHSKENPL